MTQQLILIADDLDDNRVIFSAILTHKGYGVIQALNGQEAVELAREHSPRLILMDLNMPVMDGWEATRRLTSDPLTDHVPVIAVTAEDHDDPARFLEAGFRAYIRKPIAPRALCEAVQFCLGSGNRAKGWIEIPRFPAGRGSLPEGGGTPAMGV